MGHGAKAIAAQLLGRRILQHLFNPLAAPVVGATGLVIDQQTQRSAALGDIGRCAGVDLQPKPVLVQPEGQWQQVHRNICITGGLIDPADTGDRVAPIVKLSVDNRACPSRHCPQQIQQQAPE